MLVDSPVQLRRIKRTRELTEHIVTTLKTPLVEGRALGRPEGHLERFPDVNVVLCLVLSCLLTLYTAVMSFEILFPFGLWVSEPGWLLNHSQLV